MPATFFPCSYLVVPYSFRSIRRHFIRGHFISVVVFNWKDGTQLSLVGSRLLTVPLGMFVIVAALLAPVLANTVIDIITMIAGTLLGGLLAVFLVGMFSPRTNAPGVLIRLGPGATLLAWVATHTLIPQW